MVVTERSASVMIQMRVPSRSSYIRHPRGLSSSARKGLKETGMEEQVIEQQTMWEVKAVFVRSATRHFPRQDCPTS